MTEDDEKLAGEESGLQQDASAEAATAATTEAAAATTTEAADAAPTEVAAQAVPTEAAAQAETRISLPTLFWTFAKVGVMTFGGGYAMLPILQREVVENRGWATDSELNDYFAIGQCTPGVIAVNTATFIGQKCRGIAGGIIATLGVVFPSLIIISILAGVITGFADLAAVKNAFAGIRICVCVLIFNAIIKLWKSSVVNVPTFIIFLVVAILSVALPLSPAVYVIVAAAIGLGVEAYRGRRGGEKQ